EHERPRRQAVAEAVLDGREQEGALARDVALLGESRCQRGDAVARVDGEDRLGGVAARGCRERGAEVLPDEVGHEWEAHDRPRVVPGPADDTRPENGPEGRE